MKNQDVRKVLQALQSTDVKVPRHQATLREQLLTMHTTQPPIRSRRTGLESLLLHTRAVIASRKIISAGLAAVAVIVIMLGVLLLMPTSAKDPNRKFISEAVKGSAVQSGSPDSPVCENAGACLPDSQANTWQSSTNPTPGRDTTPQPVQPSASSLPQTPNNAASPQIAYARPVPSTDEPAPAAGSNPSGSENGSGNDPLVEIGIGITVNLGPLLGDDSNDQKKDKQSKEKKEAKATAKGKPAKL